MYDMSIGAKMSFLLLFYVCMIWMLDCFWKKWFCSNDLSKCVSLIFNNVTYWTINSPPFIKCFLPQIMFGRTRRFGATAFGDKYFRTETYIIVMMCLPESGEHRLVKVWYLSFCFVQVSLVEFHVMNEYLNVRIFDFKNCIENSSEVLV